jgi:positive regulator of sigma E activity
MTTQERGIVTRIEAGFAFVRKPRSSKCDNCSGKGSCLILEQGGKVEVRVKNTLGARPGDEVSLAVGRQDTGLRRLSLFLVAVVALIAGGAVGRLCSRFAPPAVGQFLPAAFGIGSLVIAVLLWRYRSRNREQQAPQPMMEKIIRRES